MPTWEWGASRWSSVGSKAEALIERLTRRRLRDCKVIDVRANVYEEFDTDYLMIIVVVGHASPAIDPKAERMLVRDLQQRLNGEYGCMRPVIQLECAPKPKKPSPQPQKAT